MDRLVMDRVKENESRISVLSAGARHVNGVETVAIPISGLRAPTRTSTSTERACAIRRRASCNDVLTNDDAPAPDQGATAVDVSVVSAGSGGLTLPGWLRCRRRRSLGWDGSR